MTLYPFSPPVIPVPSPLMAVLSHFAERSPYALPFTSPAWQRSADIRVDTDHKAARMLRCQGVMRWERSYLTGVHCSVFHASTEASRFRLSLCVCVFVCMSVYVLCVCAIECSPESLTPAAVPRRGNGRQRARQWRITLIKDTANTLQRSGKGFQGHMSMPYGGLQHEAPFSCFST